MTATVEPNPEATRPELTDNGEGGRAPSLFGGRYGTTSLRVGAASIWLSIIVLLPLAAIVWQSAGGGWHAFWLAVTSNAALESFRVTLTISTGVTLSTSSSDCWWRGCSPATTFPVRGSSTP